MRLDRLLAEALEIEVLEARHIVAGARVLVNDICITEPAWQVLTAVETVRVDGNAVKAPEHVLLLVNKLDNCICERLRGSHSWCMAKGISYDSEAAVAARALDQDRLLAQGSKAGTSLEAAQGRKVTVTSIYDHVPEQWLLPALGCFGRLDRDTTGLILMGTDGGLQGLMLNPSTKCTKVYIAQLNPNRPLHPDAEQQFALGVLLENGKRCQPAKLERIAQDPPTVRITLAEGMYHQVKRMIKQVGSYVVKLHREQIGSFKLPDDLLPGQTRLVTADEQKALLDLFPASSRLKLADNGR
eukprot:TRINITY_DN9586_c0_g1_i4.p1 TRINITY_DN9586_c0_g1~~TRINITY_DN9586_c0_g1_i4.p1  ORF type:complete len:299 (+),score=55.37 TRINITY_DN9586_c0_g1_i4:180-1076(+)